MTRAEQMVQWLTVLTALAKDPLGSAEAPVEALMPSAGLHRH